MACGHWLTYSLRQPVSVHYVNYSINNLPYGIFKFQVAKPVVTFYSCSPLLYEHYMQDVTHTCTLFLHQNIIGGDSCSTHLI